MSKDIAFINVGTGSGFHTETGVYPTSVSGNALLANIFELTFMTDLNMSLMSFGYGGDSTQTIKLAYDSNDMQSISAMIKIAIDNTVLIMVSDQNANPGIPDTELIQSASLVSISKNTDVVSTVISIVPVAYEPQYIASGISLLLPVH